jgi:dephospho-CoA kinase
MKRLAVVGDIGSGKSYVAKSFGYPIFNADNEVNKLYRKDIRIFKKLKKKLSKHIFSYPVSKDELSNAILSNHSNLKKIIKIVHPEIRKKMNIFLRKNKKKKIIILDIPLLLENKINKKSDILIFIQSNKTEIIKRLKKRKNYNLKLLKKLNKIQLPLDYKKKKSHFIIKNNFTKDSIKEKINGILKQILKND